MRELFANETGGDNGDNNDNHHLDVLPVTVYQPDHSMTKMSRAQCHILLRLEYTRDKFQTLQSAIIGTPARRNLMGDSLLDGHQWPIYLKGAGIQRS